jgi:hypothetical protein
MINPIASPAPKHCKAANSTSALLACRLGVACCAEGGAEEEGVEQHPRARDTALFFPLDALGVGDAGEGGSGGAGGG